MIFFVGLRRNECVPFIINDTQVGLVLPEVLNKLEYHNDIFFVVRDLLTNRVRYVTMATDLEDKKKRSIQFNNVMRDWKDRDLFSSLRGWRNEVFAIKKCEILTNLPKNCPIIKFVKFLLSSNFVEFCLSLLWDWSLKRMF